MLTDFLHVQAIANVDQHMHMFVNSVRSQFGSKITMSAATVITDIELVAAFIDHYEIVFQKRDAPASRWRWIERLGAN
jgi:hypothetical protein